MDEERAREEQKDREIDRKHRADKAVLDMIVSVRNANMTVPELLAAKALFEQAQTDGGGSSGPPVLSASDEEAFDMDGLAPPPPPEELSPAGLFSPIPDDTPRVRGPRPASGAAEGLE